MAPTTQGADNSGDQQGGAAVIHSGPHVNAFEATTKFVEAKMKTKSDI